MSAVEPLGSYAETYFDGSRVEVVTTVDLPGPVSPELALVDPQLAAQARSALSDVAIERPAQRLEPALSAPAPAAPARKRRARPWRLAGACAIAAGAASVGLGVWAVANGADVPSEPSAEPESAFATVPPIEPGLSPDDVAALETAVHLEPRSLFAREALGIAYFRLGKWGAAEREFRTLIKLSPSDKFAHYALGRTLTKQGRQGEARLELDLAASLSESEKSSIDPRSG